MAQTDAAGFRDGSACAGRSSLCFHSQLNPFVTYPVLISAHFGYLVLVKSLTLYMKNRPAMACKYAMYVFNTIQVLLSLSMAIGLSGFLQYSFFNINGRFHATIEGWVFVHYVSKFLDMFDTIFMVLRKKEDQISFLHVYHHLTIGFIWGILLHNGVANGTAFFGSWINSCVHTLMYLHYLYTALGYVNPLKKYLTQLQMSQFALCILQAVLAVAFDTHIPKPYAILQLVYHMSLLYLFRQFYRRHIRQSATNGSRLPKKKVANPMLTKDANVKTVG